MLRIDPLLKPGSMTAVFRRFGRLHIPGLLVPEDAAALQRAVIGASGWRRSIHLGPGQDLDLPMDEYMARPEAERAALEAEVHAAARDSFRYMFDTVRIGQDILLGKTVDAALAEAYAFLNSETFLSFVRRLTGDHRPVYCDAMATRYLPSHFLTAHDDEAEGRHRLYAFVLNLTGRWRADWGGMLLFLDEEDHVSEGYMPVFNSLNIFQVPQRHAVSIVAPFAAGPRLAITGWVRAEKPDGWRPYA